MSLDKVKEKAKRLSRALSNKEVPQTTAAEADATAKKSEELVQDTTVDVKADTTDAAEEVKDIVADKEEKKDEIPEPNVDEPKEVAEATEAADVAEPEVAATEEAAKDATKDVKETLAVDDIKAEAEDVKKSATEIAGDVKEGNTTEAKDKTQKVIEEKTASAKEAAAKVDKEGKSNFFKKLLGKFKSSSSATAKN